MWGFARQTVDGRADSASVATIGSAGGTAANDRDDRAAVGLLPPARAARGGPLFARDVPPGAGPGIAARDSAAGHSPMM
jgi:hypothetical protein